jgi:VanZ family protein
MKAFILRYPLSIAIILVVTYLSFFKPPSTDLDKVPGIDKLVHTGMYFVMAGLLWFEFFRGRRKTKAPMWHAWVGAFLCPLVYGGTVELLQEYCTEYRGGEWLDFAANSAGVILAAIVAIALKKYWQSK